jgi:hypothetical protein
MSLSMLPVQLIEVSTKEGTLLVLNHDYGFREGPQRGW